MSRACRYLMAVAPMVPHLELSQEDSDIDQLAPRRERWARTRRRQYLPRPPAKAPALASMSAASVADQLAPHFWSLVPNHPESARLAAAVTELLRSTSR